MTVAIYYHPEAYTTSGPKLMGRNAAGESFLRGYAKYASCQNFWAQVENLEHGKNFSDSIKSFGRTEKIHVVDKSSLNLLAEPGTLYYPGPGISELALHRCMLANSNQHNKHSAWSLCGITHTTSSAAAMDAIVALITSPIQPWDAVICTSHAVKQNVQKVLQAQVDYLQDRLGVTKLILPKLPVIPLGIHTEDFNFSPVQQKKARNKLGIGNDELVVLFMGRLSFHAKAHPLAMYQALALAAVKSGKRVKLIECGWHANQHIEASYKEAQKLVCPNVEVITLDGRIPEEREKAWASADIFCSLSDNIQETFGITPIEAMATGLPVVVSDWDGYKDTVRDGIDGFRIPTLIPQAGLAIDLAARHATGLDSYDMYCGHTCALVSIDIEATTEAFYQLFLSKELREEMGQQGKIRAKQIFDWAVIIPMYENLWEELNHLRKQAHHTLAPSANHSSNHSPARMDPLSAFSGYASSITNDQTRFKLTNSNVDEALARYNTYATLSMVNYAKYLMPSQNEVFQIFHELKSEPKTLLQIVTLFESARRPWIARSLVWLTKLGLLKVAN